jgi:TPR repeat protein
MVISVTMFSRPARADGRAANEAAKALLAQKRPADALPLLREAANEGIAEAQYNLGVCYLGGAGVVADAVIANSWFERAAKQGWVDAQFKLAYSYAKGRGIRKDLKLAHRWCLKAAEQGDPECQFIVIGNYLEGLGVEKDVATGLKWAIRLGTRENPEDLTTSAHITSARMNLSRAYRDGTWGIPADKSAAYSWLLLANESKRDFSVKEQEGVIADMRRLEGVLSDAEKRRAQSDAEALIKRKLRNLDRRLQIDL